MRRSAQLYTAVVPGPHMVTADRDPASNGGKARLSSPKSSAWLVEEDVYACKVRALAGWWVGRLVGGMIGLSLGWDGLLGRLLVSQGVGVGVGCTGEDADQPQGPPPR